MRDGAIHWDLFQDVGDRERLVEVFLVESWVDHLRQHERVTEEGWPDVAAARALHAGDCPPRVTEMATDRQREPGGGSTRQARRPTSPNESLARCGPPHEWHLDLHNPLCIHVLWRIGRPVAAAGLIKTPR